MNEPDILECGGKRSATPLWISRGVMPDGRPDISIRVRSKAVPMLALSHRTPNPALIFNLPTSRDLKLS